MIFIRKECYTMIIIKESSDKELIDELNALEVVNGHSKTSYELIKQYENILKQFDVGTVISFPSDAGTDTFRKVSNDYFCWESSIAPFYDLKEKSSYDVGEWLSSRGNIARGSIVLGTDVNIDKEDEKYTNWAINNNRNFSFIKR